MSASHAVQSLESLLQGTIVEWQETKSDQSTTEAVLVKERHLFQDCLRQLAQMTDAAISVPTIEWHRLWEDADALLDRARFALHAVPYQDVSAAMLRWFSRCAMLVGLVEAGRALHKVTMSALQPPPDTTEIVNSASLREQAIKHLEKAIEMLDTGLIMAGGLGIEDSIHKWIAALEACISALEGSTVDVDSRKEKQGEERRKRPRHDTPDDLAHRLQRVLDAAEVAGREQPAATATVPAPVGCLPLKPVKRCTESVSLLAYHELLASGEPFILSDTALSEWPAMTRWRDARYLLRVLGHRWVPVEIGGRYTDASWQQALLRCDDFLRRFVVERSDNEAVGYLAQHDLFRQIPQLRGDILTPDYCYADEWAIELPEALSVSVQTHAWFGPAGTTSPLHHDPDRNLFAQVVGRKEVRLYAPSAPVYPHPADSMLHNTSQVNVVQPDLEQFPEFAHAVGYGCIVQPGELLYIPPRWWHYLRALDVSFSVSFWF